MKIHGKTVIGSRVDENSRCVHFHSKTDIIAIKFSCCETYYPCYQCHEEQAGHRARIRKREKFNEKAVLCGECGHELTVFEYLQSHSTCPSCKASFNSGCRTHYHLYFETAGE